MDKLFLEKPTITRKKDALELLNEYIEYNSEFNGMGNLNKCKNEITYEQWIKLLNNNKDLVYNFDVHSNTYFVIRKSDNKIVGMINIRYKITDEQFKKGISHIGYSIRPTERKKGYAKVSLFLGLLEEYKLGENELLLTCTVDNIGSNKTILSLGGALEKTALDVLDGKITNFYKINTFESIQKQFPKYCNLISPKKYD